MALNSFTVFDSKIQYLWLRSGYLSPAFPALLLLLLGWTIRRLIMCIWRGHPRGHFRFVSFRDALCLHTLHRRRTPEQQSRPAFPRHDANSKSFHFFNASLCLSAAAAGHRAPSNDTVCTMNKFREFLDETIRNSKELLALPTKPVGSKFWKVNERVSEEAIAAVDA